MPLQSDITILNSTDSISYSCAAKRSIQGLYNEGSLKVSIGFLKYIDFESGINLFLSFGACLKETLFSTGSLLTTDHMSLTVFKNNITLK